MKNLALIVAVVTAMWVVAVISYRTPVLAAGGTGALVVITCGTLPQAYTAGATRRLTVNTNGQVCQ